MPASYFTPATFRFLRALDRHNERAWFHAHKDDYERHVREPFLQLITDMQQPLAAISEHYRADPRKNGGSLYRIYRDTRYSNNKLPYKPWQGSRFFHVRRHEIQAPGFYLHIEPGDCFAGGGMLHPESDALKRIREFLVDNPAAWKRATRGKAFGDLQLGGESLIRPPRGYDPTHALIDDLKRKDFIASAPFSEELACSSELLPWTIATFKQAAPLVDYLCAAQELEF
ncbi:hypothetical protein UU9_11270 [Rhodanobacter fulvus Jip2]|uniref:TIGR02453 family protein n=1 Tax=Rhodanobacter fulvus Jip2 TaxID=1163408 RepID=I4VNM9_9GAMM|nr:DUF2461 domain-containing protein [Rhodanobacter fulvus]EIL88820.1 hypothetical protein UU9_11270 [Rhodanobacter fulvus Jip2]